MSDAFWRGYYAERLSALELACDRFRDIVLQQRNQLEEPCLDGDQTNAVLGAYDDTIGKVITDTQSKPKGDGHG